MTPAHTFSPTVAARHAANAMAPQPPAAAHPVVPPTSLPISLHEMAAHRGYLLRFAQRRLRDPMLAEDAVHDVFEAVLAGRASFAGRAALRSWLTAVLKHKIVDTLRRQLRFEPLDDEETPGGAAARIACPQPRPDEIAEQRERLAGTLARIDALPAALRDAMRLRVVEQRSTAAVCRTLGITEDNLFVRIHRARQRLLA